MSRTKLKIDFLIIFFLKYGTIKQRKGANHLKGQIRKALSGFYYVQSEGQVYQTRGRGNFRKRKITPLVGDQVIFESSSVTDGYLLEILPRKNELARPPVANVDQAVVVTSLVEPDFSYQLLDRFLVMLEYREIEPVIYLSKTDLLSTNDLEKEIRRTYGKIDYPVLSSDEPQVTTELKRLFSGRLTVFMGQTGVGKSSLLNRLVPELNLEIGEVSQALGRGRHTTRHVELLPIENGLVADTPGFGAIDFPDISENELSKQFPEIWQTSVDCRFRECLHVNEPDCAVKEKVDQAEISATRYQNYLQILEEIKNRKPIYKKKR